MTTPSEMASGATHSNSGPTESGQAGEPQADSGQAGEQDLRDTFMAAGKSLFQGLSRDDLLDRMIRHYLDAQLQRANINHMKKEQDLQGQLQAKELELKDAEQAKELELKDARKAKELELQAKELELKDAELLANNLKWQAAVQAETTADKIRSWVLIAVVLALVGYWFGQRDRVRAPQPTEDTDHKTGPRIP